MKMKSTALMILSVALIFGFVAYGNSCSWCGWGYTNFAFHGYPTMPVVSYYPTHFSFFAAGGFNYPTHYYYQPSVTRFTFIDP